MNKAVAGILFLALSVSNQVCSQREASYGPPNYPRLTSGSSRALTGPSSSDHVMSSGPRATSTSGSRSRGRIVGNSVLEYEHSTSSVKTGNRPAVRYRQQQAQTYRSGSLMSSNKPITTGPSVGPVHNGIDDGIEARPGMERNRISEDRNDSEDSDAQKIFRYVSVHVPPPEPIRPQRQRAALKPKKPEVHYQIVFIKAPTVSSQELQEIQLPPPPQTKTMVYVLLKKPEVNDLVKITQPTKPARPHKPEVYFIRYKSDQEKKKGSGRKTGNDQSEMIDQMSGNDEEEDVITNPQDELIVDEGNDPENVVTLDDDETNRLEQQKAVTVRNEDSVGSLSGTDARERLRQNLGGYDDPEISDNDFSSYQPYNQNQLLLSNYPQQQQQQHQVNNQNERLVQSGGYHFTPVSTQYGVAG